MSRHPQFPRSVVADSDYWLCRCHGFRVDSPARRVGQVEEVRFGSRHDRPDAIVLRAGVFANRRLVVPVADVTEVLPREQRLILAATPVGQRHHERLRRLRNFLGAALGAR